MRKPSKGCDSSARFASLPAHLKRLLLELPTAPADQRTLAAMEQSEERPA